MSGGHFEYKQYHLQSIEEEIEGLIEEQANPVDEYTEKFSPETIARFKEGVIAMRIAYVYANRIDWLVSGDDGEESFHERLEQELGEALFPREEE